MDNNSKKITVMFNIQFTVIYFPKGKKKESGKIHVRMNIGYEELGYSLKYKKQTDIEAR